MSWKHKVMVPVESTDYPSDLFDRLPIFVYGTLRSGQGNAGLLGDRAIREPATVNGFRLYGKDGRLPIVAFGYPGEPVVGELITLGGSVADDAIRNDVDRLEGFDPDSVRNNFYLRIENLATVTGSGREEPCWIYVASDALSLQLHPDDRVLSGDWVGAQTGDIG